MNNQGQLPEELRKAQIESMLGGQDNNVPIFKAEGAKGGVIIGHTQSGKPIYDSHSHPAHNDFYAKEHKEAARVHATASDSHHKSHEEAKESSKEAMGRGDSKEYIASEKNVKEHYESAKHHAVQSEAHETSARKIKETQEKIKSKKEEDSKSDKIDVSKHTDKELHDAKMLRLKNGMSEKHSEVKQIEAEQEKRKKK